VSLAGFGQPWQLNVHTDSGEVLHLSLQTLGTVYQVGANP
jgi:hypothetical protein